MYHCGIDKISYWDGKEWIDVMANQVDTFDSLTNPETMLAGLPPVPSGYKVEIHRQVIDYNSAESYAVLLRPYDSRNKKEYGTSVQFTRRQLITLPLYTFRSMIAGEIRRCYMTVLEAFNKENPHYNIHYGHAHDAGMNAGVMTTQVIEAMRRQAEASIFKQMPTLGQFTGTASLAGTALTAEDDSGEPEEDAPKTAPKKSKDPNINFW